MPPVNEQPTPRRRVRLLANMEEEFIEPGVRTEDETASVAKIYFYDEVGGWGVWPDEFQRQLSRITAPVIELHIHSPGGDAFDGIAIYNMLRQHDAKVNVVVDGLAASAASVIAMAGDRIQMSKGSQLMVHDAWGMSVGPADEMEKMAGELNRMSDQIAGIYQARAGGTVKGWRKAMTEESWYSDKEAVEAGLATHVEPKQTAAKNRWATGEIFAYAGREEAGEPDFPGGRKKPTPVSPAAAAQQMAAAAKARRAALETPDANQATGSTTNPEEAPTMPVDVAKLREALGLAPEAATDAAVETFGNALSAALSGGATAPATTTPAAATAPANTTQTDLVPPPQVNAAGRESGAVLLDPDTLRKLQESAQKGETAWAQMKRNERDGVILAAINAGKFPPEREEYWKQLWDRDPDGTRASIEQLASNVIPVLSAGYLGDDSAHRSRDAQAYAGLYGEEG